MTNFLAIAPISTISTRFTAITSDPQNIDWAQTGRNLLTALYRIAVAIGVIFYLAFLLAQTAFRAAQKVQALWVQYEVTAKIQAAYAAMPGLSVRVAEVQKGYATFGTQVKVIVQSMQADYAAISAAKFSK